MNDIKFRVWCGERLRIVNALGWVDGELDFVDSPKYNGPVEDEVVVMQYVWLKDVKNREIFEGDIVKCFTEGYSIVVKKRQAYGLETKGIFTPFYEIYGHCEVIGNIYEDKHLLRQ